MPKNPKGRPLWREPLLHFLLIGGVLYGLDAARAPETSAAEGVEPIVVLPSMAPEAARQLVEEEALYREAKRLGLDQGDLVVRRRLVQKMEFLLEDLAAPPPPDEADLRAWLAAHPDKYRAPARVTLEHVYFSRDRRKDAVGADALAALQAPDAAAGDPFLGGRRFEQRTEQDLARTFGPDFAAAVMKLEPGRWGGPVASAYGRHLVRVESFSPAAPATLEDVRARVEADVVEARRREAAAKARAEIVARYPIERQKH
jgi:hypothetical protein